LHIQLAPGGMAPGRYLPERHQVAWEKYRMKNNVKAALLSALVLPGLGQIYRGRLVKGGVLLGLVTIVLVLFVILMLLSIQDVLEVARLSGKIDAAVLAQRLQGRVPGAVSLGGIFLCMWIYSVADALFGGGAKEDSNERKSASH